MIQHQRPLISALNKNGKFYVQKGIVVVAITSGASDEILMLDDLGDCDDNCSLMGFPNGRKRKRLDNPERRDSVARVWWQT